MKIILAGGSGQIGAMLAREFGREPSNDIVILARNAVHVSTNGVRTVRWDGHSLGPWVTEIDGADVVINLAGRSVNCRYTGANLGAMMQSRIDSARIIGKAIAQAKSPPPLWLQMSTATIYAHRFDAPNDEATGIIGGHESDVPRYWDASIAIAKAWEDALTAAPTPRTRKVALRSAMVMSADAGGVFATMAGLSKCGLGGTHGSGRQFVSWIHEHDFTAAIRFLISRADIAGPVNLSAPEPLPQSEFQRVLREALNVRIHFPMAEWMMKTGAVFMRTDAELVLKSRRVVPTRLLEAGFNFKFPTWKSAANELAKR